MFCVFGEVVTPMLETRSSIPVGICFFFCENYKFSTILDFRVCKFLSDWVPQKGLICF